MFGFKNSNIYVEGQGIIKTNLKIENGKFTSFEKEDNFVELEDKYIIAPGFIDEHIHGANGSDTMDATYEALHNIASSLTKDGVTSFLATTMTMEEDKIISALNEIGKFERNENDANLIGVHLEGPFISAKYCGAQDPSKIIKATPEKIKEYHNASNNKIKIITLAPEECEDNVYQTMKELNIVASAGHTNASANDIKNATKHGLTMTTHTYNAMRGIHHREIGTVGAALLYDNLACEIICDLHHVSEDAIRLLYKSKPIDKLILITDSMEARFLKDGMYKLGGQDVKVENGTARLLDGTLAGSILHMNDAIKNFKNVCKTSLEEAIDKATINPARNLNIEAYKGSIALNKDADFVIIDKDLNVYATFINGKLVYKR